MAVFQNRNSNFVVVAKDKKDFDQIVSKLMPPAESPRTIVQQTRVNQAVNALRKAPYRFGN